MEKSVVTLEKGTTCSAWNYSGHRLATGSVDGNLSIFDSTDPSCSSSLTLTSQFKVHDSSIVKIVWAPPEYGDALACICADGTLSLWEEVVEEAEPLRWKLCKNFDRSSNLVLDIQFGICLDSLKLVSAYSDGLVKVYELQDSLELNNWQLQVWEFDQDHQRWLPVAELALAEDEGNSVYSVAWAPNIGRPFEVIAVATLKGIAIWHFGLNPESDGRLSAERVALVSDHGGEMEWDMSGMTLGTTGSDGFVRLLQADLNGVWHEQAVLKPTT